MRTLAIFIVAGFVALASAPALTAATASNDGLVTVTWQFDASETAPFDMPRTWNRCTVTVPVGSSAGDAFDAAVADESCGITSHAFLVYDIGRFLDELNGASTACASDPTGFVWACRYWAFYANHLASETGLDDTEVADGDVLALNFELSVWPVSVPNPATLHWLADSEYEPVLA